MLGPMKMSLFVKSSEKVEFWKILQQHCSNDQEKLLKFESEGREFAKFLRSQVQFIQAVKGQKHFW